VAQHIGEDEPTDASPTTRSATFWPRRETCTRSACWVSLTAVLTCPPGVILTWPTLAGSAIVGSASSAVFSAAATGASDSVTAGVAWMTTTFERSMLDGSTAPVSNDSA
jgi:hypothetical protein